MNTTFDYVWQKRDFPGPISSLLRIATIEIALFIYFLAIDFVKRLFFSCFCHGGQKPAFKLCWKILKKALSVEVQLVCLYASFQNGRHFSILLLTCKLALVDSFTGKYSNLQVNERILKWRQFWRKVYYIKNKFHVFVGLFSIRSENWQKTSKCGKNWTSVTHSAVSPRIATFSFLPHFDIILDLLLNRRTATWNLFVNCKEG